MTVRQLQGRRICVLGLGVNNRAITAYLLSHGCAVTARDSNPESLERFRNEFGMDLPFERRDDVLDGLDGFDVLIRTPVIAANEPLLVAARERGAVVTSQTKLFFDWSPARIIGVTGTKGKGTTCTLIYNMLQAGYAEGRSYLAGNIGVDPFSFLEELRPNDLVVLELSSFQLEDLDRSPWIGVLLEVGADHLDRHASLEEYRSAKLNILSHQREGDYAVVNAKSLPLLDGVQTPAVRLAYGLPGGAAWMEGERVQGLKIAYDVSGRKLRGAHNLDNIMPAMIIGELLGINPHVLQREAKLFPGLKHRLQLVGEVAGVRYYDDSIATTPESALVALQAFPGERVHLIAGGNSKGGDYSALADAAGGCQSVWMLPGSVRESWPSSANLHFVEGPDPAGAAIRHMRPLLQPGDIVLLSPGGTSFASYASYADRGDHFQAAITALDAD